MIRKYVTKEYNGTVHSETYSLRQHAATNLRRYDFFADIEHLENLKNSNDITCGFVIFLTNVLSYKQPTTGMGQAFNFSNNITITQDTYSWIENVNVNSITEKRNRSIIIGHPLSVYMAFLFYN